MNVLDWLLDSDPAIRWQALRDLTDAPAAEVERERARIPRQGLGARILETQHVDGVWRRPGEPDWVPTLFTMLLLRATAADPEDPLIAASVRRAAHGFRWHEEFGAKPFFEGEVEPCINGGTLAVASYFLHPNQSLLERLLSEQLADGGWNCDAPKSARSSFHTTICVLEGLLEYERAAGASAALTAARRRGHEYLLERRLHLRLTTGAPVSDAFLKFGFPPRYEYDVLRALDYFRAVGGTPDARLAPAVEILRGRRLSDGRYLLDRSHADTLPFAFPEAAGEPSRWNTLRALRVLAWLDRA